MATAWSSLDQAPPRRRLPHQGVGFLCRTPSGWKHSWCLNLPVCSWWPSPPNIVPCHRGVVLCERSGLAPLDGLWRTPTWGQQEDTQGTGSRPEQPAKRRVVLGIPCRLNQLARPCVFPSCWCRSVKMGHFTKTIRSLKRNGRNVHSLHFIHRPSRTTRKMLASIMQLHGSWPLEPCMLPAARSAL